MDTKKLRQKILDLAIHGKLVPQDPNDEPASVLLERIRAEKEQLIKEGKIKAPKKSKTAGDTSHYGKEYLFDLPDTWAMASVQEVFQINPKNNVSDDSDAGFVPMANISDGFSDCFTYEIRPWRTIKSGFTHFADNDVAVAKISPCLENRKSFIAKGLPNGIGAGTTELFVFRSSQIEPEYSLLFFKSAFFISSCVGTFNGVVGQQRASRSIIEDLVFPIPPRSEQLRIIQKVRSLFEDIVIIEQGQSVVKESVTRCKEKILDLAIHGMLVSQDPLDEPAIELLRRINPSFLPSDNLHYEDYPLGWQDVTLKEIISLYSGRDLEASSCNTEHRGIPYLVGASCIEGHSISVYRWTEHPEVIAKQNDVLLSCKGTVGEVLLNAIGDVHIARQFMAIRSRAPQLILPEYLELIIKASIEELKSAARGIIPGLSREDILEMRAGIPPLAEQKRILLRINEMEDSLSYISQSVSN